MLCWFIGQINNISTIIVICEIVSWIQCLLVEKTVLLLLPYFHQKHWILPCLAWYQQSWMPAPGLGLGTFQKFPIDFKFSNGSALRKMKMALPSQRCFQACTSGHLFNLSPENYRYLFVLFGFKVNILMRSPKTQGSIASVLWTHSRLLRWEQWKS